MKTVKFQTARVNWRMGQSLLPGHFLAQESSMREESVLRFRMLPTPQWGVGALQWDAYQLAKGMLSIQELVLLLPSGALIDIPGNCHPVSFNLNRTGAAKTPLYVHLQGSHAVGVADGGVDDDGVIERAMHQVTLSSTPYSDSAVQAFKLAELEKGVDGTWSLSADYMPPLVRVTHSPFFERTHRRIEALCAVLHQHLLTEVQENYLAAQSVLAVREALKGFYRFRAMLANVGQDLHPHPYDIFRALHDLYVELCVLRGTEPVGGDVYAHEEPQRSFRELLDQIEAQVQLGRAATPYASFSRSEGLMVCRLPAAARKARQVYWLMQKPSVSARLDISGVRIASESRLALVHQRALRGVPIQRLESPPFHHTFSSEVEFFTLALGDEWDHVVREGKVVFFHRPELDQAKFFLYWRND